MAGLIGSQASGSRYADVGDGAFHLVPDAATAAANGFDWNDVFWYGSEDGFPGSIGDPLGGGGGGGQGGLPTVGGLPELVGLPDGRVFLLDNGTYRHIPDPPTLSALGFDWSQITWQDALPGAAGAELPSSSAPPAPPPPAPPPPAAAASPASGSFVWGGLTWSSGDLSKFIGYLSAHGVTYADWANNHAGAAAILEGPPADPSREPVPKSVGEALGMAIAAGATPAEAAAGAAALAASQLAQGFGAPSGPALLQAAQDVADAYTAAGGGTGLASAPVDEGVDAAVASDGPIYALAFRSEQSATIAAAELPAKAWQDLRDQLVKDMPFIGAHVRARGAGMRSPLASELWSSSI